MTQILGNFAGWFGNSMIFLIYFQEFSTSARQYPTYLSFLSLSEICVPHPGPPTSGEHVYSTQDEGDRTQGPLGALPKDPNSNIVGQFPGCCPVMHFPKQTVPGSHGLQPWFFHCHCISGAYLWIRRSKTPHGLSFLVLGKGCQAMLVMARTVNHTVLGSVHLYHPQLHEAVVEWKQRQKDLPLWSQASFSVTPVLN